MCAAFRLHPTPRPQAYHPFAVAICFSETFHYLVHFIHIHALAPLRMLQHISVSIGFAEHLALAIDKLRSRNDGILVLQGLVSETRGFHSAFSGLCFGRFSGMRLFSQTELLSGIESRPLCHCLWWRKRCSDNRKVCSFQAATAQWRGL